MQASTIPLPIPLHLPPQTLTLTLVHHLLHHPDLFTTSTSLHLLHLPSHRLLLSTSPTTLSCFSLLQDSTFRPFPIQFRGKISNQVEIGGECGWRVTGRGNVVVVVGGRVVWVMVGRVEEGSFLGLRRCAVVEFHGVVTGLGVGSGVLVVGVGGGVRVFNLRLLVKGWRRRRKGVGEDPIGDAGKHRTLKLKKNSLDTFSTLIEIKAAEVQGSHSKIGFKVVSIHELSTKKILIVDSVGDVHLLSMQNSSVESNFSFQLRHLDCPMKVRLLAVSADTSSSRPQVIWMSDASYSLHMVSLPDLEMTVDEENSDECRQKSLPLRTTEVIFTSEKIHGIAPLGNNGVLVLGQGNMFTYAAV